jgi:cyclopropane fatty-acyl-phospholipid synthase-like methyltransferase
MSRNLAPYTKKIIGVDISQGMVDYYNQRVYNQGIPEDQMRALCVHLTGADTDLDGQKFDVIVVSSS